MHPSSMRSAADVSRVSPITMEKAARAGERSVQIALQRVAEWLGIAASNMIVTLHPDLIVIGGGVSEMGDLLLVPMRQTVKARVGMLPPESVRIERSALGDRAGLMGGFALAIR